jgi:hypothetical protein
MGECGWGVTLSLGASNRDGPNGATNRTIKDVAEWNQLVDGFDVAGTVMQLVEVKACWVFLAVGAVDGWFLAPNPIFDEIMNNTPATSRASRRNLVADLGIALQGTGIRLGVYLPANPPYEDPSGKVMEIFKWTPIAFEDGMVPTEVYNPWARFFGVGATGCPVGQICDASNITAQPGYGACVDGCVGRPYNNGSRQYHFQPPNYPVEDMRLVEFQGMWNRVIAEWSHSFGTKVSAWWFDGCYFPYAMYDFPDDDHPNFSDFAGAARAGNPDSSVAFNSWITPLGSTVLWSQTTHQDFTAGETNGGTNFSGWPAAYNQSRGMHGSQHHIYTYLGTSWSKPTPRFETAYVEALTAQYVTNRWAITWDVRPNDKGLIEPQFMEQLRALKHLSKLKMDEE